MPRDEGGRFGAGESGNPGGRPAADAVARNLRGRRARRALLELLRSVAGDDRLLVVVVDGRGLVGEFPQRGAANSVSAAVDGLADGAGETVLRRQSARHAAYGELLLEWEPCGTPAVQRFRRRADGLVVGWNQWCDLQDAALERQLAAVGGGLDDDRAD